MAEIRVAIAGLGAIGLKVARRIDSGDIERLVLTAVSARDQVKAERTIASFRNPPKLLPLERLAEEADVVVECVPAAHFLAAAEGPIRLGRIFMPLSVGALLNHMHLVDLARETGARIVVPSGAILGLDAVRAVAEGNVHSVRLITRKPPAGLAGAPLLVEKGISVEGLKEPLKVFSGTAREAAKGFPANLNVSVALSLAGVGPDRTEVEVWADPTVSHNTHTIIVKSDSSQLTMTIENIPSAENPRTGVITPLSVIAALRRLASPLVVGT
ncbi:MAG: putative aspartate dehydrogenase [Proteobacteria bacterium]|jgi:aspartate dehydrogenase|nr:MAG: putative aspartate dehydrogenase [Pseudomonadota bacterium]